MSWMEEGLKQTLKRRPPRPGFTGRVLARAAESRRQRRNWLRGALAAAACLIVILAGHGYREEQRRREAEKVSAEVQFAMNVAASKVQFVQAKLAGFGLEARQEHSR